jgi:hypothetical protein
VRSGCSGEKSGKKTDKGEGLHVLMDFFVVVEKVCWVRVSADSQSQVALLYLRQDSLELLGQEDIRTRRSWPLHLSAKQGGKHMTIRGL